MECEEDFCAGLEDFEMKREEWLVEVMFLWFW